MLYLLNKCSSDTEIGGLGVHLAHDGDTTTVSLCGRGQENTPILVSTEKGIAQSIRKSIGYIGRKTESLKEEDNATFAALFTDKPSEVALYIKGLKISLEPSTDDSAAPIIIKGVEDSEVTDVAEGKEKVWYPKDIVVVATDKQSDKLVLRCDKRNIVGEPIAIQGEQYDLIMFIPKWPTWSVLKFPAYFSIGTKTTDKAGEAVYNTVCSVKLGSRTANGVAKNQIDEVDIAEANDYLAESERRFREKNLSNAVDRINKKYGSNQAKDHQRRNNKDEGGNTKMAKGKGNSGKNNKSGSRTGVPPMYTDKGGNTKSAQNSNKKNPRKSGNR